MIWLLGSRTLLLYLTSMVLCAPQQEVLSTVHVSESVIGNNASTLRRFHLDLGSKQDVLELFDSIEVS